MYLRIRNYFYWSNEQYYVVLLGVLGFQALPSVRLTLGTKVVLLSLVGSLAFIRLGEVCAASETAEISKLC